MALIMGTQTAEQAFVTFHIYMMTTNITNCSVLSRQIHCLLLLESCHLRNVHVLGITTNPLLHFKIML